MPQGFGFVCVFVCVFFFRCMNSRIYKVQMLAIILSYLTGVIRSVINISSSEKQLSCFERCAAERSKSLVHTILDLEHFHHANRCSSNCNIMDFQPTMIHYWGYNSRLAQGKKKSV